MFLNDAGRMVEKEWSALPQRFPNVQLHENIVRPNHFAIMEITNNNGKAVGAMMKCIENNPKIL
jgi:hypothetical protein